MWPNLHHSSFDPGLKLMVVYTFSPSVSLSLSLSMSPSICLPLFSSSFEKVCYNLQQDEKPCEGNPPTGRSFLIGTPQLAIHLPTVSRRMSKSK